MSDNSCTDDNEERNFIEAKIIIQEFIDDPTVFVVGTAPFGKLWFDHDKINQQYKTLSDSWEDEYGEKEATQCKKPRIISVLLDESDPMFNKYRDSIRDAQEKKQQYQRAINAKKELEMKMASTSQSQEDHELQDNKTNDGNTATLISETTPCPPKKKTKKVVAKKKKNGEDTPPVEVINTQHNDNVTVEQTEKEKPEKKVKKTKKTVTADAKASVKE